MFIRFDGMHERDGRTDGRTDGQALRGGIGRACASHRAAKTARQIFVTARGLVSVARVVIAVVHHTLLT